MRSVLKFLFLRVFIGDLEKKKALKVNWHNKKWEKNLKQNFSISLLIHTKKYHAEKQQKKGRKPSRTGRRATGPASWPHLTGGRREAPSRWRR
jgi:hypothetical protein